MNETTPYEEPSLSGNPQKSGNGCLIASIVIIALFLLAGFYIFSNFRYYAAKFTHSQIVDRVTQSPIPQDQKDGLIAQLDRLRDAYLEEKINTEDIQQLTLEIQNTQIIPMASCLFFEHAYINASSLSDDEKKDAILQTQRFARGVHQKKIKPIQAEKATETMFVANPQQPDSVELKPKLTDPEIKQVIANMKKTSDDAQITNDPYKIDLATELKKVVDNLLTKKTSSLNNFCCNSTFENN